MVNVISEIALWSRDLPYWEQVALGKIVSGKVIGEDDYEELLRLLLEDAGLVKKTEAVRSTPRIAQLAIQDTSSQRGRWRLRKVANLGNVNALAPHQTLTFHPKLTVIFGANGSGKSGYARVISSGAFTRGDKEVLSNVAQPSSLDKPATAEIELATDTEQASFVYQVGEHRPEMQRIYAFDSTAVRAHLTKPNTMSFSPAGLTHLTQLVEITDEVRRRLQKECDRRRGPNPFANVFQGETEIAAIVRQLGPNTNIKTLSSPWINLSGA